MHVRPRRWRIGLAVSVVLLVSGPAAATTYVGRDFVMAFLPNIDLPPFGDPPPQLQLASEVGIEVTVEYPMIAPSFTTTVAVPAGTVVTVDLPRTAAQGWGAGSVVDNAVHAFTTTPPPARFAVTMVNREPESSDSALALPADALGREYIVLSVTPQIPNGQFVVVADEPATTVTITPTNDLVGGHPAGVPFTVTLARGEGFYGRTALTASGTDLSGTLIEATGNVTVSNGVQCTNVPPPRNPCDHLFEVAVPVADWGRRVLVEGLPERPAGSIYRVVAAEDATTVTLDGAPFATLNRAQFATTDELPGGHVFQADRPVAVLQAWTSALSVPSLLSDPAVANMWPLGDYGRSYLFATVGNTQFGQHWATIVAADADVAAGTILLDGSPIPAADFTPIGTTGFSSTVQPLAAGTHRTTSSNAHHVTVEGAATYDSYLHPAAPQAYPPDHFLCYRTRLEEERTVTLVDEFDAGFYRIARADALCAPADKNGEGIVDPAIHLLRYRAKGPGTPRTGVALSNQFGRVTVDLRRTHSLLVPTTKSHRPAPPPASPDPNAHAVDHYRCVNVGVTPGTPVPPAVDVTVTDQFGADRVLRVRGPQRLCIPTDKNGEGVEQPRAYLLCYRARAKPSHPDEVVQAANQFSTALLPVVRAETMLCVPSHPIGDGSCCVPEPIRCRVNGVDAGECATPAGLAACTLAGGECVGVSCEQLCGNGTIEPWCCEDCDDGTRLPGDFCSATCAFEPCCVPQPLRCLQDRAVPCESDLDCEAAGVGGSCVGFSCAQLCGSGTVEPWCCEECDDGNREDGDGCSSACQLGDCVPQPLRCLGAEHIPCATDGDCPGGPCVGVSCAERCGNGIVEPWCCEECDDGTRLDGDGCSATCQAQPCCVPQPTRCLANPGVPCDDDGDCARAGVGGSCVSFACPLECGDGEIDAFCCERCDDAKTCEAQ